MRVEIESMQNVGSQQTIGFEGDKSSIFLEGASTQLL